MTELRSCVSGVSKPDEKMGLRILQLIHESFLDKKYQTHAYWKVTDIKKIDAPQLEHSFQRKKLEMERMRTSEELKEEYLFTCYKSDEHINVIAQQGLYVQQSKFNFLGDSLLGVILCRHADIQLKAAQNENQPKCWLMVFKVLCGRRLTVHPAGDLVRRPTEGADCHVSSIPPVLGETLGCQAIKSQVYLYESDPTCVTGYSLRPRQCVPQAYVEFFSCSALGSSLPPVAHLPYPTSIIPHQSISSSSSLHTSALDFIPPNQCVPFTGGAPVRHDIQLTRPAVSLGQKFPPYVPKSTSLRNRMQSIPVVSPSSSNIPTYSTLMNFRQMNWQQPAARTFIGEGSSNTSCLESNANFVNSGPLGCPQQLAARPCASKDCTTKPSRMDDRGLQVLLLNRSLVIELLQTFAKEMNAVAEVWKASGFDATSCLKNAVDAVQELKALFMQIAPVCQQFYKFAQDLFSGNTNKSPSLTVVQHMLTCLTTCQSSMSTAFKYFHDCTAQTTNAKQKAILMAQAVMSKQLLLLNCLTLLQGTLISFNGFHTNRSGIVTEERANQNSGMPDLPVKNSASVLLPRQPGVPTTVPETASMLSPSLASLVEMSGGEIRQLSASWRQESVNSVRVQSNRACELLRNDSQSNSSVSRICAERTMLSETDEAQSDLCSAENSNSQFVERRPIVITPDDGLIDEVVNMNSTPSATDGKFLPISTSIKLEKTTSRDRRCITETIFIDADELIAECIGVKNVEPGRDCSDATGTSSTPFGLVLDILDEKNPGTSLAKVFCVSPDATNESEPDNIELCALSSSCTTKEQQSLAEAATTFEDCSLGQTHQASDDEDFTPSEKYHGFFEHSQPEEVCSVAENIEPEYVVTIEPTTEEPSDSEEPLAENLNFHHPAKNGTCQAIADPDVVPEVSTDVHYTLVTCTEKDSLQLEKTCATNTAEVDGVVQILQKKKCFKQKLRAFVKRKLFVIGKFPYGIKRSNGRKKSTTLKKMLTLRPKSGKRRGSKTSRRKSCCAQAIEREAADVGDVFTKVSNAETLQVSEAAEVVEMLQISEGAEVIAVSVLKETDDNVAENLSAVAFRVTGGQSQGLPSHDLSAGTAICRETCTDAAPNDVLSLERSSDDYVFAKTSDSILKSSALVNSMNACNSEAPGDEQPFKNMDSDVCVIKKDNVAALVCRELIAETMHVALRTAKSEPVATEFEQKPRLFEDQKAVDDEMDEIIAEVVANAAEFDGGDSDADSDDAGFLKIRIENVCSIAPEGFESMNNSSSVKTESGVYAEESAEHKSSGVTTLVCDLSVTPQISFKTEDGFKEASAVRTNDLVVTEDVVGTHFLISNSEATREVISAAKPASLIIASSSQAVAKEQTCQEEEIDVGDAEYSASIGQTQIKALKDRISDLVHGENFDDCDVEFDVQYENMSDEDKEEECEQNDLSKCEGNAEPELSEEILKFYSLGGDNYETADVHSTLDLMTLNVKKAPAGSAIGAESSRKPVKKRKSNGSGGRKRRRKRKKSTPNVGANAVKGKSPIENQGLGLAVPKEKSSEIASECVDDSGKKESVVENLVSTDGLGIRGRKRFNRKEVRESNVNAFLVSADAEKLCCALPELGLDSGAITSELEGKSVNDEGIESHAKSLCSESHGPDLLEKEAENLELPKLGEAQKADVHDARLEGEATGGNKEICVKDSPSVEDVQQIESAVSTGHLEESETTKTKKRKRRYAMTGRSKRRKRTASPQKMCAGDGKFIKNTENNDTNIGEVEVSEQGNDYKTDEALLLPMDDGDKKGADIPEAVLNLFVKSAAPVELSSVQCNRTSPRRRAAVLGEQSDTVKPKTFCRKRRASSKSINSSSDSTLLDMLNDHKFLETLKSAVKIVEGGSSGCRNGSEPAGTVGGAEASVEESSPVYFTDIISTSQDGDENSKSSYVNAELVNGKSEDVDGLNCWKPSSEEHLEVNTLACSVGTSGTPYFENGEAQTSYCSGLDSTVSAVSYRALISAVDSAGSSISYDAIRNALKMVASSKGLAPSHAVETVDLGRQTAEPLRPNSDALSDTSKKDTCVESAQSSSSNLLEPKRAADAGTKDPSVGSGHSSAKVVIPLSVYLRNVRQSNYQIIKHTETNNEPAFYTGVVKPSADCPAYFANQERRHANLISSRDPRLARMKQQQSSVVQPLMQLETPLPESLPRTVLAHYSSVQNFQETELQTDASFHSPVQNMGSFHSFGNTENPIRSNPLVNKPVCSITPFVHQTNEQPGDSVPAVSSSKQYEGTPPSKLPWDGSWKLIPISNLPPRPPIIFARLPLSERKIDVSFLSDPRIRSERELSVRKQLSRPDKVCDDAPLVIDGEDASVNPKRRRSLGGGGVLSNGNFTLKDSNNWDVTAAKAKDWFFQGKPPSDAGAAATKRSLSENLSSQMSKGKPDEILNDLLSSLHTESFEGETMRNVEAGMLCGLNKDRVLAKRSPLIPKLISTSDKHRSSVDGRSPALVHHNHDRDHRKRDHRDVKPNQTMGNVHQRDKRSRPISDVHQRDRDKRSHSRTSSHRPHMKDDLHSRRDHSSRRDFPRSESSGIRDDKSIQRSHVKPRPDINREDSAVSLISTDSANKKSGVEEKRPKNEECFKRRQHSADEKTKSADEKKRQHSADEKTKSTDERKPQHSADEKTKSTDERKPQHSADERTKSTDERKRQHSADERTKSTDGNKPQHSEKRPKNEECIERRQHSADDKTKSVDERKRQHSADEKTKSTDGNKPQHSADERTKNTDERKREHSGDERTKSTDGNKPQHSADKRTKSTDERKREHSGDERTKRTDGNKRQHSADEEPKSADEKKCLKKSPSPRSSSTHKDERRDYVKPLHCNKDDKLKSLSETEKEKHLLKLKTNDTKTCKLVDEALQRKERPKMHSSRVDDDRELHLKRHDHKGHGSRSGAGRKPAEALDEKSNRRELDKSRRHSHESSGSKESLHGQDKGKLLPRGEPVEKRRSSYSDVKTHAGIKGGDCSKTLCSVEKIRHKPLQSPTESSSLQQNPASVEDVRFGLNEEKNMNDRPSAKCAVDKLESNADTSLSRASSSGSLASHRLPPVDFTEADDDGGGSLVIHMEDVGEKKDCETSHMDPIASCVKTDGNTGFKVSDTNKPEKTCMSSVSVTDEASPSDEKELADKVDERNERKPGKSCYEGESCSVAQKKQAQILADILQSIRSQKSQLEDRLKSNVDASDVVHCDSRTIETNSSTLSSDGLSENSSELSSFISSDFVGNLSEAGRNTGVLLSGDGPNPMQNSSSSDSSTKSGYSKSSVSSMASVQGTDSMVSSELEEVSENASASRSKSACVELELEKSESIDNGCQDRGVPSSKEAASPGFPSTFPEIRDCEAAELSYVTQEHVDDVAEKLESRSVEDGDEDNLKNDGDQGNNLAQNVAGRVLFETQKAADCERETVDLTGTYIISDCIDVEPNTATVYCDSGEDGGLDETTAEVYGGQGSLSVVCTPLENCERSVSGINDAEEGHYTSQGTGKHSEMQCESPDQSVDPANSGIGSYTVRTHKVRAADFFHDVPSSVSTSSLNSIVSQNCSQLQTGSYEIEKTEPDTLVYKLQGLETDETFPESLPGNLMESGDRCKGESSSDVAEPSCSSKPPVPSRARRRSGRIADEWSNISSRWKELSRDHDEPANEDEPDVGRSECTELPSDISAEALAAYKEVFKKEVAMTEQKIIDSCIFTDPCEGLSESQIKKLLRLNAANPEVEEELRLEYDILDLDKDVSKIQDCLDKIKNQLSLYRSLALNKTYDDVEQKFNFLLVKKEMYQYRLTTLRRYHKSHFVHVMPREFLFDEEDGKYISLEGMLLFLHMPTISVHNCVRLSALKTEIVQTRDAMVKTSLKQVEDVKRLVIKLRWLHLQRKVLLQQLCCSTERGRQQLIQYLAERLTWYRALQSEVTGDEQSEEDTHSFVRFTINEFESYIRTLKSVQKSTSNGRWMMNTTQTARKHNHSRSSAEARKHDSVEHSSAKPRRQAEGNGDFYPSTSSRGGWQKEGNAPCYDQADPVLSEDGRERWSESRQVQRSSEFEGNRSRYEQGEERMDFEDEGEQWLNPRYGCRGGNSEDVWHEEVEHPWDCLETKDRYEQLNKTHRQRHSTRYVVSVSAHWSSRSRRFPVRAEKSYHQEKCRDRHRIEQSRRRWYTRPGYEDSKYGRSWFDQHH